jgi:hypothetical protein
MTQNLIEATKEAIGYKTELNSCCNCKHSELVDNKPDSELLCKASNLCSFVVLPTAVCNKHEEPNLYL